jgi:hypothetical protein
METDMSRVQPQTLTDEELLRHIYIYGFNDVPPDWVQLLCTRFANLLDKVREMEDDLK